MIHFKGHYYGKNYKFIEEAVLFLAEELSDAKRKLSIEAMLKAEMSIIKHSDFHPSEEQKNKIAKWHKLQYYKKDTDKKIKDLIEDLDQMLDLGIIKEKQ